MKVAIGGMIASGKSTLVEGLSKELNYPAMKEFEEDDIVFNTILQWLYDGVKNVDMLLQFYFLHNHWNAQKQYMGNVIVDKHIIENLIFANIHLKDDELLSIYYELISTYIERVRKPDIYIILDMSWNTFVKRIYKRGRAQEIDNFKDNEKYFKTLMGEYVSHLSRYCNNMDIPFEIINTDSLTEEEVLRHTLTIIDKHRK